MSEATNQQIRLASRPSGWVTEDNFTLTEEAMPEPGDGQLLVRNIFMSVDPYMRGRMNDTKSYVPPFQIGEVLVAGAVGQVVASNNPDYAEGDYVVGMLGWENYSLSDGAQLRKIEAGALPLSYHLGVLGMPGMTAYVGLHKIAEARAEDVVGQLAKIHGCRVAGCAGSDDKVALLTNELGYDAAFNYRSSKSLTGSMAEVCPEGIDVNFENVGGEIFEAALWSMRDFGRVALCGMISNYNDEQLQPGPRGMAVIIGRRLRIQGFIVTDHPEACQEYALKAAGWLADGKLQYRETIAEGVENAPAAFINMLKGGNTGKQIVQLAAP